MSKRASLVVGALSLLAFVGTIFAANWAIGHYGVVSVGFSLMAPAGVFFIGVAFTLRDLVQRHLGRITVVAAIIVGAGLSYLVNPALALASGAAFLVSELADFGIYTPLQKKSFVGAVLLSNTVGALLDSYIFLTIAFGSLAFFWGQVVGKLEMTLLALPLIYFARKSLRPAVESG